MFGIGSTELAIILLFAFLILGPDKLPQFAKTVGRAIAKFRDVQDEVNEVVKREVNNATTEKKEPAKKPAPQAATAKEAPTESFAERKARYDKMREERLAAQRAQEQQGQDSAAASADGASSDDAPVANKPAVSAEELYGLVSKPAPKSDGPGAGASTMVPADNAPGVAGAAVEGAGASAAGSSTSDAEGGER